MPATVWQIFNTKGNQWPETEFMLICWNFLIKTCEIKLIVFDLGGQIFSICPPTPPFPLVGYVVVQSEHNSVLRAKSLQDLRTCVRNMKLWVPGSHGTNLFFRICGCHIFKSSNLWVSVRQATHGTHSNACPEENRQTRRRRLRATTSLYCILCYVKIVAKPPLMHSKVLLRIVLFNNSFLYRFSLTLLLNPLRESKHKSIYLHEHRNHEMWQSIWYYSHVWFLKTFLTDWVPIKFEHDFWFW